MRLEPEAVEETDPPARQHGCRAQRRAKSRIPTAVPLSPACRPSSAALRPMQYHATTQTCRPRRALPEWEGARVQGGESLSWSGGTGISPNESFTRPATAPTRLDRLLCLLDPALALGKLRQGIDCGGRERGSQCCLDWVGKRAEHGICPCAGTSGGSAATTTPSSTQAAGCARDSAAAPRPKMIRPNSCRSSQVASCAENCTGTHVAARLTLPCMLTNRRTCTQIYQQVGALLPQHSTGWRTSTTLMVSL